MRQVCSITERILETPSTVTLRFDYDPATQPGQFVMLWIPGDDEIPMSLSYVGRRKGVTVKVMGSTSRNIQSLSVGSQVGIRGPYGNHFDLSPQSLLVVGGGSGAAVLAPAAEAARQRGASLTVALGATTAAELLFAQRFRSMGARVVTATDDGTEGIHGFVTVPTESLLRESSFDAVWTCGPEVMMRKVAALAAQRNVSTYCSVERHMKCALGLCDACALGPLHVCVDGPVFPAQQLVTIPEFGTRKRDPSGRRVPQ